MKNKILVYSIIFFILYLLEVTIIPLKLFNCTPEYVFIAVILISMFEKEKYGALYGLAAGLFCDFSVGWLFGLRGILYMLIGYCIGFLLAKIMSLNLITSYLLFIASFLLYQIINYGIFTMFKENESIDNIFTYLVFPKLVISLPFVAVLYFIFKNVHIKLFDFEKEEKQFWQ